MYKDFFGLRQDPFRLSPDPSFLFLTDQHREALSALTLAILQRKGLVVLTGEVGTGKTTLLTRILQFLPSSRLQYSLIANPAVTRPEFLEFALLNFGVTELPASKGHRLCTLLNLIVEGQRQGKVSVLIVDEAQKLSDEVLQEIRLLGDLEDAEDRFLQILLVGQPEFDETLNREAFRPLVQRIGVRLSIGPLAPTEVGEYMRHRWLRAGGTELPFTEQAIEDIAIASHSIPRLINGLCDNSLLAAAAAKSSQVQDKHVREAAALLDLELPPREEALVSAAANGSFQEPKSSPWNRLAGRFRLTPRPESM